MIDFRTLLLVPALGLTTVLSAQESAPPTPKPAAQAPDAAAAGTRIDALIRDLGSESYRTRLQAERELKELGDKAVAALGKAAEHNADGEVQWRARRLLRQIEGGVADGGAVERRRADGQPGGEPEVDTDAPRSTAPRNPGGATARRPGVSGGDLRSQFESLFERFERDFGVDVPRARFFEDGFFHDLQDQLRSGSGSSQGMSMQIGPNGVRVEVQQKNDKGEIENKVYEAPDLETFHKQYPDVLRQNGLGMGLNPLRMPTLRRFSWPTTPGGGWVTPEHVAPQIDDSPTAEPATPRALPPTGRRLGVSIRPEVGAELREYLGLEDGVGLMIEGVQEDTLAEALGLEAGDIVTRIGDQKIGSPADVQKALGAIEKGKPVAVRFLRKGVEKTASADKTEAAEAESPASRLERRRGKQDGQIR